MQSTRRVTPNEVIFGPAVVLAGVGQEPKSGQSIYVVAGAIAEIGPADQIRQQHPNARLIDVSGTTILPGLTDAHGHLYGLGLSLDTVNTSLHRLLRDRALRMESATRWTIVRK